MNFRTLKKEQLDYINNIYKIFSEENLNSLRNFKLKPKKTTIEYLQKVLFKKRDSSEDYSMLINPNSFDTKEYLSYNEENGSVYEGFTKEKKVVGQFEVKDYLPRPYQLDTICFNEINNQVLHSFGGSNSCDWKEVYKEKEFNPKSLLGYHIVDGVPFVGTYSVDDDYMAVFVVIYIDEEDNVRGYVPIKGNCLDSENLRAWSYGCFKVKKDYYEFCNLKMTQKDYGEYFNYDEILEDLKENLLCEETDGVIHQNLAYDHTYILDFKDICSLLQSIPENIGLILNGLFIVYSDIKINENEEHFDIYLLNKHSEVITFFKLRKNSMASFRKLNLSGTNEVWEIVMP